MLESRNSRSADLCLVLILFAAVISTGCGAGKQPVLQPLRDLPPQSRVPVIFIPGLTGTRLLDTATGKLEWGNARRVFWPKNRCHSGIVPIDPESSKQNTIEPEQIVWQVKALGLFPVRAFISIVDLLEANGYRLGDLDDPQPDDTLFFFAYDWRLDIENSVERLAAQLEALRVARGEDVLHVILAGQSGGGRIARWYVKYGASTVEQAEAGTARPAENVVVDKIVLVATANGGAIRVFGEIHNGRRYVPLGRLYSAETFFSFRGLFDELPVYDDVFFVDREGHPLEVDLFDPANWKKYGWSIYRKKPYREALRLPEYFGDEDAWAAYLARTLDRAYRFQVQLQRDVDPAPPTRYYQIQSSFVPSPGRAMLHQKKDGTWITAFPKDGHIKHDPRLPEIVTDPGDGHATVKSVSAIAPQEKTAMARDIAWVDGTHFAMIHDPRTQQALLNFLLD